MNKVVEILMKRDGMSQADAELLVEDTRSELIDACYGTSLTDVEDIIMNNLGLESDYLFDILN